ncbi:hypothetical protein V9K67_19705 [Paraflavisolibacter sp. H34]|uniref:hypothetical protein n=1 Tax=Huijunlia imazamoxiresistens TaxID=3127457 RepID=UPI00301679E5
MKHRFNVFAVTALALMMTTTATVGCKKSIQSETVSETSIASAANNSTTTGTITAQSVQVNVGGIQQFYQLTEREKWSFSFSTPADASTGFSTYFTLSVTGSLNAAQLEHAKQQAFLDNMCNLWSGTALVPVTTSFGKNGSATCTPVSAEPYALKTGWSVDLSGNSSVDVNLSNIFVASASFQERQEKKGVVTKKYSFSMGNDAETSRLSGLKIELLHNGAVVETRTDLAHTLEQNADWYYVANAGIFGNELGKYALANGVGSERKVSEILLGDVDNFAGNNGTGGTRAVIANQSFTNLALDGDYTVRISGNVKGNSFEADQSFSIEKKVVTVGGCK